MQRKCRAFLRASFRTCAKAALRPTLPEHSKPDRRFQRLIEPGAAVERHVGAGVRTFERLQIVEPEQRPRTIRDAACRLNGAGGAINEKPRRGERGRGVEPNAAGADACRGGAVTCAVEYSLDRKVPHTLHE